MTRLTGVAALNVWRAGLLFGAIDLVKKLAAVRAQARARVLPAPLFQGNAAGIASTARDCSHRKSGGPLRKRPGQRCSLHKITVTQGTS
jgi:hypothetical protein